MTEPSLGAILARIEAIELKLDALLAALAAIDVEESDDGERDQNEPL